MTTLAPIEPHLTVSGGEEALAFYAAAFGAEVAMRMPAQDGRRLLYASLRAFGATFALSDEFPEYGADTAAPPTRGGASVTVNVNLPAAGEVDAAVARAEAAGATVTMAPADTFWNARYARLRDPFGHAWSFNAPLATRPLAGVEPREPGMIDESPRRP